jgi:hypothetical protein
MLNIKTSKSQLTRMIQSLYYAPAGRYINAWMHLIEKNTGVSTVMGFGHAPTF